MIRMLLQIHSNSSCWQTCPIYFCCLIPCGYWNLSPKGEDIFVNFTDPLTLLRVRASDDLRWSQMISDEGLKKWMQFGVVRLRDMRLGGRHVPRGDLHSARVRGEHNLGSMVACQVYQVWARFSFEQVLTTWKLVNFNLSRVLCQYHKCRQKVWKALEAAVNVMHGICF